jgi:hypothetical protein
MAFWVGLARLRPTGQRRSNFAGGEIGGGKGIRTPGLLIANETLYQLSYTPPCMWMRD